MKALIHIYKCVCKIKLIFTEKQTHKGQIIVFINVILYKYTMYYRFSF